MKISKDGFKVKDKISIGEYLLLVEEIVDFSFLKDDNGRKLQYTPHYVTAGLPALVVNFCMEGIEIEPHEAGYFSAELVNAISENEELNKAVRNIIDGVGIFEGTAPMYFQDAIDDAEKIIKVELEKLSPANQLLIEANDILEKFNDTLGEIDIKSFAQNLESILGSGDTEIEVDVEPDVKEETKTANGEE